MADPTEWRDRAECRYHDPELFFPVGTGLLAQSQIRQATAVCDICPVRTQCLEWSLDADISDGIWGGVEEDGRQRMRRSRLKRLSRARRAER